VKRTWKNDEDMHRLRLSKRFGSTAINAITQQNVQQFHNDLRATGMAPATADHHLKFLRHALNLAVEWGLLESNPAAKVKQFNEDNQVERYLSDDELSRLVKVLATYENRPMACLVLWLLSTGARSGEAKAANWEDINLEQRVWIVKSENSKSKRRRSIALNDVAISVLEEIKSMGNTSGALFVGRKGRYRYLNKNWAHLCERADLKDLRMHDLRHNYASMLVNAGHSLYEVQQSLGHSDPKVTMRYSHLSKATLQEAANSASQRIQAAMGV
jgi:integrase